MKPKKIPMRKCAGCNQSKPKKELVRIVRTAEGEIFLDTTGKKSGRGVYVCRDINCLSSARKAKRLERSLSTDEIKVVIPDEVYSRLEEELAKDE
ncbi:MAG: YlxR family protein [Clostridia bacterium]|nr:YlxR family protein [Clostridia bacterium]